MTKAICPNCGGDKIYEKVITEAYYLITHYQNGSADLDFDEILFEDAVSEDYYCDNCKSYFLSLKEQQ